MSKRAKVAVSSSKRCEKSRFLARGVGGTFCTDQRTAPITALAPVDLPELVRLCNLN